MGTYLPATTKPRRAQHHYGAQQGTRDVAVHGLPRLLPLGVAPVPDGDGGGVPESQGQAGRSRRSCVWRGPMSVAPVCRGPRQSERHQRHAAVAAVPGRHWRPVAASRHALYYQWPHPHATLLRCRRDLPSLRFSDVAAPQDVHRGADDVQPPPRGHPKGRGAAVWRIDEALSCCALPWALPLCVAASDDLQGHLHSA